MDQDIHIMKMCCYVFHYSRLDVLYVHVGANYGAPSPSNWQKTIMKHTDSVLEEKEKKKS